MTDYIESIIEEVEEREALMASIDNLIAASIVAEFREASYEVA